MPSATEVRRKKGAGKLYWGMGPAQKAMGSWTTHFRQLVKGYLYWRIRLFGRSAMSLMELKLEVEDANGYFLLE